MSITIETLLNDLSLHIDSDYEEFANNFCNPEGYKKEKTKTMFTLSSWFEGYLFCALIGLNINDRRKYSSAKKEKSRTWSKDYREQLAYVLSLILSKDDIKNELFIYDREQIDSSNLNEDDLIKQLKNICDEYVNGGLYYLKSEWEKDNRLFDSYNSIERVFLKSKKVN
jgi:hypothetical protein